MESTLRLQSSARQERQYPAHDPLLPHYSAIFNKFRADPVINLQNSHNSIEGYRDPHSPPPPVEFPVDISEILPESSDEEILPSEIHSPSTEYESPFSEIQVGQTSTTTDDSESNSSILSTNGQHMTTRPHYFSTPKTAAYLFGLCTTFLLISLKLTRESHTVNPFIIMSLVAYVMAFLHLLILAWIHKRLDNTNSSHQNVYLGCYRILEIFYYIMCYIAFVSASIAVLITLHHPQTNFTPPPPPPPHPHPHLSPPPPPPHPHPPPPPPPHPRHH